MKKLSIQDYDKLAKDALYDFAKAEGKNPAELLCELSPNLTNSMKKKLKDADIDPKYLSNSIKRELMNIINSKRFTDALLEHCAYEVEYLKEDL